MGGNWRERAATTFSKRRPATGSRGIEQAIPEAVCEKLRAMGHRVAPMATVGGGMNAIQFNNDGSLTGAACWRADGTPVAIAGGLAQAGVRFGLR